MLVESGVHLYILPKFVTRSVLGHTPKNGTKLTEQNVKIYSSRAV